MKIIQFKEFVIDFQNMKQRISSKNVFVFDLETINEQEFAESYAAGLYDMNRLRDQWDRDLTPDEIATKKDSVIVFDVSNGKPVMNMLK